MTDWEAKYHVIAAGASVADVEAAERLVNAALHMGQTSNQTPGYCLSMMVTAVNAVMRAKR